MTYQELAKQSLEVQDACNLQGVVGAFARGMAVIRDEANRLGEGTDWVNENPIVTLFLDKLAHLNKSQGEANHHAVFTAYDRVNAIVEGKVAA